MIQLWSGASKCEHQVDTVKVRWSSGEIGARLKAIQRQHVGLNQLRFTH